MPFSKNNPYINASTGEPDFKNLRDAIAWERKQELNKRKDLPKSEIKAIEEEESNFSKKMQSSVS